MAFPLVGLANSFVHGGAFDAARPLLQRALKIREAALPNPHPDTAETLYHLARLAALEGDLDNALVLLQRAFEQGFSASTRVGERDFSTLRGSAEFQALVNRVANQLPHK